MTRGAPDIVLLATGQSMRRTVHGLGLQTRGPDATLQGQFNFVDIVIQPMEDNTSEVLIRTKEGIDISKS
jgi:hypothetical protein